MMGGVARSILSAAGMLGLTAGQTGIAGLGLLLIGAALLSGRRRRLDRYNSPAAYERERMLRVAEERRVIEDVEAVMARLEQLARDVEARVEEQLARLTGATYEPGGGPCACVGAEGESEAPHDSPGAGGLEVTIGDAAGGFPISHAGEPVSSRAHVRGAILRLAGEGNSPAVIARQLRKSLGEVELTLAVAAAKRDRAAR